MKWTRYLYLRTRENDIKHQRMDIGASKTAIHSFLIEQQLYQALLAASCVLLEHFIVSYSWTKWHKSTILKKHKKRTLLKPRRLVVGSIGAQHYALLNPTRQTL